MFPERLCDTEVFVAGRAAGLLYVSAGQINFKVPQQTPVEGTVEIRVSHKGISGPAVILPLAKMASTGDSQQLADEIWSGLQAVKWETPDRGKACRAVPPYQGLRGGLHGHAYYCRQQPGEVIAETFHYPVDAAPPAILLRRADFRLANAYPERSAEVEQLLIQRLTREYGQATVPDHVYEIGASRPNPGRVWQAGHIAIFLHRNRNHVAPAGVREGVLLIAVHREVLRERELITQLDQAFASQQVVNDDLNKAVGGYYVAQVKHPMTEAERAIAERETRAALLLLLRQRNQGDRGRRAAILVAADDLTLRLGSVLVSGSGEVPGAAPIRLQLASYGIRYTGLGHYSGALEYDRSLLRRAWKEFPDTPWGQRAFLMLQRLSCSIPEFGCSGPNCFLTVIKAGENFLREYPDTAFRKEQIYHLAVANETWWSLSRAEQEDPTAEGAQVDKSSGERARKRAIELYEELIRTAPESLEARAAQLVLPRLKLELGTGERTFFCFSC